MNQPRSPYAWVNEYVDYLNQPRERSGPREMLPVLEYMRRSHLPAEVVLEFAKEVMTRPELTEALEEQTRLTTHNIHEDDFAILGAFTGYYAWKNGIDDFQKLSLNYGYDVVRDVIRGDLESLDSDEALDRLRSFPEVD
ncbi:hypothetical protein [Pelagibius marinus]|uniref:hypothetical protein n=1 Tax=Pelagibius marinus TaxID=2762760 RepID=UPI0018727ACE|nr:hypothetical protein [Pelagibius marinus]